MIVGTDVVLHSLAGPMSVADGAISGDNAADSPGAPTTTGIEVLIEHSVPRYVYGIST